jgi:glycosyltransferase involved in cell wall biosynthesis
MKNGISIIVCCYNSVQRLPETIKHLALQEIDNNILWEVIIIDNASTDDTSNIANIEWEKWNKNVEFRVLSETRSGLSHARKTGVNSAQFQYIIFCDDDNWLGPNYVQQAFEIMTQNPMIGMLGGRGIPVSEIELPQWFEGKKNGYAVGSQSSHNGEVEENRLLWGAGVVLRTDVMLKIYDSNIDSLLVGRNGNQLSSGDDSELAIWHIILGYKLWYDDRLIFHHFIPKERLTESYVTNLFDGFVYSNQIIDLYLRILEYQTSARRNGKVTILVKSLFKILFTKMHVVNFSAALPRLKENIQLIFNSKIIFNERLAKVQIDVVNKLNVINKSK